MITPTPVMPLKPGSARGRSSASRRNRGRRGRQAGGSRARRATWSIKTPWPAMMRTIYGDPERYVSAPTGASTPAGTSTGDSARKDEDGYFWIIGRVDDVIKVCGYRLGTAEVESALVSHPAVAEAAAIGLPHEVKGNAIHTFVILRAGFERQRGAGRGAAPARGPRDGPDRQARRRSSSSPSCRRRARARSCAGC